MNDLHHKYWKEMVIFSTKRYCRKMLELCSNPYENCEPKYFEDSVDFAIDLENPVDRYLDKVIDLHKRYELKFHLEELERESPFPNELKGYLHEYTKGGHDKVFQPLHLMKKRETYRDKNEPITFEFLIEYDLLSPDVEIYYGIKAISDSLETTPEFASYVQGLSLSWFEMIRLSENGESGLINKKYVAKCKKLKFTNNVHDGTFWIAWGRLESMDEENKEKDFSNEYRNFLNISNLERLMEYHKNSFGNTSRYRAQNLSKDRGDELKSPLNALIQDIKEKRDKKGYPAQYWLSADKENDVHYRRSEIIRFIEEYVDNPQSYPKDKNDRCRKKVSIRNYVEVFIDDACKIKDKDSLDGKPILTPLPDGRYRFNCSDQEMRYFIHKLYNPEDILLAEVIFSENIGSMKNLLSILKKDERYIRIEAYLKQFRIWIDWTVIRKLFVDKDNNVVEPSFGTTARSKVIDSIPNILGKYNKNKIRPN